MSPSVGGGFKQAQRQIQDFLDHDHHLPKSKLKVLPCSVVNTSFWRFLR